MKKIILLLIIGIAVGLYLTYGQNQNLDESINNKTNIQNNIKNKITAKINKPIMAKVVATPKTNTSLKLAIPQTEEQALDSFGMVMEKFSRPEMKKEQLLTLLTDWQLDPIQKIDSNEDTGSLSIIRTRKTLPGTRYFHAQYFSDDNGQTLQHLSFEFRPGPDAMKKAITAVKKQFSINSKPTFERPGFISWNQNDTYSVWIKTLTKDDLRDDPFNAYSAEDVGTVRVAMELEIHGHSDGDSKIENHQHKKNEEE